MATRSYTLADLAPDLSDVAVSAWYVTPGQQVREDDDMLDLVTDKAAVTLPVPANGRVVSIGPRLRAPVDAEQVLVTLEVSSHG
jgi:pyruvate/2-oxoglutarate dehydrogenase complex dihydrolipoamide acyltransferase (E2) component